MLSTKRLLLALCIALCCATPPIFSYPHGDDIIVVQEIVQCAELCKNSADALITTHEQQQRPSAVNVDNESVMDVVNDLILPVKKPSELQQQLAQKRQSQTTASYQQIDLLSSAVEDALTAVSSLSAPSSSASASGSASASVEHVVVVNEAGVPHEIELRADDVVDAADDDAELELEANESAESVDDARRAHRYVTPIDMSDFVTLIPAAEVKSIAVNYYRNDPEVQRAYTFLSSREFVALKQHIIAAPEMSAFLHYLNNSGLDLVGFLHAVTNLTSKHALLERPPEKLANLNGSEGRATSSGVSNGNTHGPTDNEIVRAQHMTTAAPATTPMETTTREQLNGLHGLVDSILDILPQDQILATFFDKLETNEQFSKLVNDIGSPAFAKILSSMQKSVPLRNFIFTLHNNGIFITRIVDSLKAYFFLGTF